MAEVIRLNTPEGRFEAEQAYIAYRKKHDPLHKSVLGVVYTDDPLTQSPNPARGRIVPAGLAPCAGDSYSIDGAKGI